METPFGRRPRHGDRLRSFVGRPRQDFAAIGKCPPPASEQRPQVNRSRGFGSPLVGYCETRSSAARRRRCSPAASRPSNRRQLAGARKIQLPNQVTGRHCGLWMAGYRAGPLRLAGAEEANRGETSTGSLRLRSGKATGRRPPPGLIGQRRSAWGAVRTGRTGRCTQTDSPDQPESTVRAAMGRRPGGRTWRKVSRVGGI